MVAGLKANDYRISVAVLAIVRSKTIPLPPRAGSREERKNIHEIPEASDGPDR